MKTIISVLLFSLSSFAYGTTDHKMIQAGKAFLGDISDGDIEGLKGSNKKFKKSKVRKKTVKEITISVDDTITFVNKDPMEHNVANPKMEINLKQLKGSSEKIKFDKAGVYKFRCNIHPRMKLKVTVK